MEEEKTPNGNPLDAFTETGSVPVPAELAAFRESVRPVDAVGEYLPEEDDPNVLIFGPWLERGGSAFWISTAGTGKSIACMQLAHAMSEGHPFCGLRPRGRLRFWIFQSEDSPRRVAQDRADIRAELAEQIPGVKWEECGERVKFVKLTGTTGITFLAELDRLLSTAAKIGEKPDVIILNPLLAFVGGPITDGAYVTPFLRGGEVNGSKTTGLQAILERHGVGVLIFHHTPKPPTEKEIDAWMKSTFPEYQCAGSSDITNWGRSFVTMMRVKGHADMVCVTAGKNGAELGWERVGGAPRRYMAYSNETGVSGKGRHAWRDLTEEEYAEVVGEEKKDDEQKVDDAVGAVVAAIKAAKVAPCCGMNQIAQLMQGTTIRRVVLRAAISKVIAEADKYRLTIKPILHPRNRWVKHIGLADSIRAAQAERAQGRKYADAMDSAENAPNVAPLEPSVAPTTAPTPEETPPQEEDNDFFEF